MQIQIDERHLSPMNHTFNAATLLCLLALPAHAHIGVTPAHSFLSGLAHPFGGLDHLAAMVAVGLWATTNGGRKVWLWPVAFMLTMVAGAGLGVSGVALPYVEPTIAASVVVLGILATVALKVPAAVGTLLVALFAIAHGHAHGTDQAGAEASTYMLGFAASTAALLGFGVLIGVVGTRTGGLTIARLAGLATVAAGASLYIR
jgi:urease accessory protein